MRGSGTPGRACACRTAESPGSTASHNRKQQQRRPDRPRIPQPLASPTSWRVAVVVMTLCAAACVPRTAAQAPCSFASSSETPLTILLRHNNAPVGASGQLYLPESPVTFSFSAPTSNPGIAISADAVDTDDFLILNTTNLNEPIDNNAFERCAFNSVTYIVINGTTAALRTPPAAAANATIKYLAFSDGAVSLERTVTYSCGCPTAQCAPCTACTISCPVEHVLVNQTCHNAIIPDSACEPTPERAAMLDLRALSPVLTAAWDDVDHQCNWDGITCDTTQSVTGISLTSFAGTISLSMLPSSLANLQNLATLEAPSANLTAVSPVLAQLPALRVLNLASNPLGPGPLPAFVWSLPLRQLGVPSTGLRGNLSATGQQVRLRATLDKIDVSGNFLTGPPPVAANASHTVQLTLQQSGPYLFDCNGANATLDVGASADLTDITSTTCTLCGAPYALANLSPSVFPAPATADNEGVLFTCAPGFLTSTTATAFNLTCQLDGSGLPGYYECSAPTPGECRCIEVVDVVLFRDITFTFSSSHPPLSSFNTTLFVTTLAAAIGASPASIVLRIPPASTSDQTIAARVAVTTQTVSGFTTDPLAAVDAALQDATALQTAFSAHAYFSALSGVTVEVVVTTSTTTLAPASTTTAPTTAAPNSDSSSLPIPIIAGVAGGVAFLALLFLVICLISRRRRAKTNPDIVTMVDTGVLPGGSSTGSSTPIQGRGDRQVMNPLFDDSTAAEGIDGSSTDGGGGGVALNQKRRMVLGNTMGASSDTGAQVLQFDDLGDADVATETDDAAAKNAQQRASLVMEKVAGFGFDMGETSDGETFNLDDGGFGDDEDVDVDAFDLDAIADAETQAAASATKTPPRKRRSSVGRGGGGASGDEDMEDLTGFGDKSLVHSNPFITGLFPQQPTDVDDDDERLGAGENEATHGFADQSGAEVPPLPAKHEPHSAASVETTSTVATTATTATPLQPPPQLPKEEEEEEEAGPPPPPPAKSHTPQDTVAPQPAATTTTAAAPPPALPAKSTPAPAAKAKDSPYSSLPPRSKTASTSAMDGRASAASVSSVGSPKPGLSRNTSASSRLSIKRSEEDRRAAREARINALKAAKEEAKRSQMRHPSQWSFNECVAWLRHHDFKEFVDVFYNNGFEGKHLVALQARSFTGVRSVSQDRVLALIDAIARLKEVGYWVPPDIDDDDVDTLAPLEEEEAPSGPPLPTTPAPPSTLPPSLATPAAPSSSTAAPPPPSSLPPSLAQMTPPAPPPTTTLPPRSGPLPPVPAPGPSAPDNGVVGSSGSAIGGGGVVGGAVDTSDAMETARIDYILSQHLTRDDAKALLKFGHGDEGEYLFRASQSSPGAVVLSMCHANTLHNFQIKRQGPLYVTPNGLTFSSLPELVGHFKQHDNAGLPCRLSHACTHYDHLIPKPANDSFGFGDDVTYDDLDSVQKQVPAEDEYEVLEATQTQRAQFAAMRASVQP
ncbi:hypothetical protein PTSG_01845 [Salpingoeca rosetta]|uniref:SH2 domain-containing protein n=1 Tax=Salpingoeca rosetta (strain ATCC 50818 / BSB-021) TaxID=946362 RepID=F2TZ44_SALR5|nr:uncharacterized protein PTSG_01845 [Salpingoeca rosetta]EGD78868.1 hypothetical protein PTSG_01845 [Salpingoeca rosetta]|eukprot:XP_004997824.1 hypothetical protein PTSG_01845 [Salpingoeca rosetta]